MYYGCLYYILVRMNAIHVLFIGFLWYSGSGCITKRANLTDVTAVVYDLRSRLRKQVDWLVMRMRQPHRFRRSSTWYISRDTPDCWRYGTLNPQGNAHSFIHIHQERRSLLHRSAAPFAFAMYSIRSPISPRAYYNA